MNTLVFIHLRLRKVILNGFNLFLHYCKNITYFISVSRLPFRFKGIKKYFFFSFNYNLSYLAFEYDVE